MKKTEKNKRKFSRIFNRRFFFFLITTNHTVISHHINNNNKKKKNTLKVKKYTIIIKNIFPKQKI